MPLYFFDSRDDLRSVADDIGSELADLEEAKQEAMEALVGIARDRLPDGNFRDLSMTIRDGSGPLIVVSLSLDVTYLEGTPEPAPGSAPVALHQ
jgi:hypothetical protein